MADPTATTARTPLWAILAGLVLAIGLGYGVAGSAPDFADLALGEDTKSVYGSYAGDNIFCGSIAEAPQCLGPARARGLDRQLLWLGNSQLHAINQPRPGDATAPILLARRERPRGAEIQAMSFPNASLTEFYLAWLFHKADRPIDVLVVPVFLDDTREGEVRDILQPLARDPGIAATLRRTAAGRAIIASVPAPSDADAGSAADAALQQRSETAITAALEACCGFQTMREKARGQIEITVYRVRNWAFGVDAQTVRPIIAQAYDRNLAALGELLADARGSGTRVILYIPPLRQDVAPPYAPADYARFKADTRALAARAGARWIDIDGIVPGPLWGTKAATGLGGTPEFDFMHFQEPGHVAVAQALTPVIEAALASSQAPLASPPAAAR